MHKHTPCALTAPLFETDNSLPVYRSSAADREFDIEFRGFFFGEGHLDLVRQGRTTRGISPRIRIGLREDDKPTLEAIQVRYGGNLSYRKSTRAWTWQLTGKRAVLAVLSVLSHGILPIRKRSQISLMIEACSLIPVRGTNHLSDKTVARLYELREELKAHRRFEQG